MTLSHILQNMQKKCSESDRSSKILARTIRHSSYLTRPLNPPSSSVDELTWARRAVLRTGAVPDPDSSRPRGDNPQTGLWLSLLGDKRIHGVAAIPSGASNDNLAAG